MRCALPLVALSLAVAPTGALAQEARYTPTYANPKGRELVAVFISASQCIGNSYPGFLESIDPMNRALAAHATSQGLPFVAIGVTTDWIPDSGYAYLQRLSRFDEINVGRNWFNLGLVTYVWADSAGKPVEPQVVLLERHVTIAPRVAVSRGRVLRRIRGADSIVAWVREGAPIPKLQPN